MIDKIFEKTEESITRLNQTISLFERDFTALKTKFDGEVETFKLRANQEANNFRSGIDTILGETEDKTRKIKDDLKDILEDQSAKLVELLNENIKQFEVSAFQKLEALNEEIEDNFERLKATLEVKYREVEEKAKEDAQKAFEYDIAQIFEKFADKIAPYVFKALLRYILRFGRK